MKFSEREVGALFYRNIQKVIEKIFTFIFWLLEEQFFSI